MLSQEYKNNPRMTQSRLKWILDGVEEFKHRLDNPTPSSDSQNLGQAVHLLLLQPHLTDKVECMPKIDKRTKEGKEIFAAYQEKIDLGTHGIFLSEDDYKKAHAMAEAVRQNEDCMKLLEACTNFEKINLYRHKGIDFKCQLDGIGNNFILDLKTTRISNNDWVIRREIQNNLYHFQAASYLTSQKNVQHYYILFVRSEAPYAVFPIKLSNELLTEGKSQFDKACDLYNECLMSNTDFKPNNKIKII